MCIHLLMHAEVLEDYVYIQQIVKNQPAQRGFVPIMEQSAAIKVRFFVKISLSNCKLNFFANFQL